MWQDNLELLQGYFLSAEEILKREGRKLDALDISTGPCLAPLMATMRCIDRIQLSDFDGSNRERITRSDIGYWRQYAKELVRIFPEHHLDADALLSDVDRLRKESKPIEVDLRRTPAFFPNVIEKASVGLMTMHFVVDSICETPEECFVLLRKAVEFIRPGGYLLQSALIESKGWYLGDVLEPSPNLRESQFDDFFVEHGFKVCKRTQSIRKDGQIYDGGWTIFLAKKDGK